MKIYTALIYGLLVLIITACTGQAQNTPVLTNAEIAVRVEPEPLTIGETTLIITLKDSNGTPINGATMQVHGNMDHAGMAPVDREVSESTNGDYRVPFEWTMGGGW
ncbi:MAG TPA: FixH family protein, partial [Aggregatilineales bacterium]|nr:FixH family protein [Aggregatilineales bacterium]